MLQVMAILTEQTLLYLLKGFSTASALRIEDPRSIPSIFS